MFKGSKRPTSMILEELCMRSAREASYKYGIDYERLYSIAKKGEEAFEEFEDALNQELDNNAEQLIKMLRKQGALTAVQLDRNIRNVSELFASIFTFRNCKRFIYDSKEANTAEFLLKGVPDSIKRNNFMDVFDEVDDMIIDIKTRDGYSSFMIRICRAIYTLENKKGSDLESFNVTYLLHKDSRSIILNQFIVAKNVFPNLMIDFHSTGMQCASGIRCSRSVLMDTVYKNENISESRELCYMSEKKMNEGVCLLCSLKPYDILHIAAYVWDMYKNRHTLERRNSKRREHYKTHEVSMLEPEDRVIRPMHSYYKYEREKKPWQGGHHQSPVMHERRAHERVYLNEDGSVKKVVQVKGSVVNKDGKRAFHEVGRPNTMKLS